MVIPYLPCWEVLLHFAGIIVFFWIIVAFYKEKQKKTDEEILRLKNQQKIDTEKLNEKDEEVQRLKDQQKTKNEESQRLMDQQTFFIEELNEKDEEILRLKDENMDQYEEILRLKEQIKSLEKGATASENTESSEDVTKCHERPSLLQGRVRAVMDRMVYHMSTTTFSRFVRMSKEMFKMAANGILRKEVALKCKSAMCFRLLCDERPLGLQKLCQLKNSPWFTPRIDEIAAKTAVDIEDDDEEDENAVEADQLLDLMKFVNAKEINEFVLMGDFDLDAVLQNCKIHSLRADNFTNFDLFESERVRNIPKIGFGCERAIGVIERNTEYFNGLAQQFVMQGTSTFIALSMVHFPSSFIIKLMEAWIVGERTIKGFYLGSEDDIPIEDYIFGLRKMVNFPIKDVDCDLCDVSADEFTKLKIPKPAIVRGTDYRFIIARQDGSLLYVFIGECNAILELI